MKRHSPTVQPPHTSPQLLRIEINYIPDYQLSVINYCPSRNGHAGCDQHFMCPLPVQLILHHRQGVHITFLKHKWMFSGQQQLQIVNLHMTRAKHCIGAVASSATANIVAGMHIATAAGAITTRVQHPCSGSGGGGTRGLEVVLSCALSILLIFRQSKLTTLQL